MEKTEINKIKKQAEKIIKKNHNMNKKCREELAELGFYQADLGCGRRSSYICSKQIKIMSPVTWDKRWEGKTLLVVGMCNITRNKYSVYRGMVLEIEPPKKNQRITKKWFKSILLSEEALTGSKIDPESAWKELKKELNEIGRGCIAQKTLTENRASIIWKHFSFIINDDKWNGA